MRRTKGFILTEILTSMALQAGFVIVLCSSFYLMLSFYARTQQVLNARQKGEKVIAYVEARIRNVGLGLQECRSSHEIREAFREITNLVDMSKSTPQFPVSITSGDTADTDALNEAIVKRYGNKIKGNILTLLYTQRPQGLNITIRTYEDEHTNVSGDNIPVDIQHDRNDFGLVSTKYYKTSRFTFNESDFVAAGDNRKNLSSYTVLSGTGVPLFLRREDDNGHFQLIYTGSKEHVWIYPGDELLYLKCDRFFVKGHNFTFQNFKIFKNDEPTKDATAWSKAYSNELDILGTYFELDTEKNILDMYVLASGGTNDLRNTPKPSSWPQEFWKPEFEDYTIYVSRASWKLNNISFDKGLPNHGWN